MRKIVHIGCDCFCVTPEMHGGPSLRSKALVVGGSPDKCGVIATYSHETRAYGAHSVMVMRAALELCPSLLVMCPCSGVYQAVSKQIRAIFRNYTDLIKSFPLDEAYLGVSASSHFAGSTTWITQDICRRVAEELHITVSIGAAPNKSLVETANDWRKPDGLFVITPERINGFVTELPMTKLRDIGEATAERLARMGAHTCANLRQGSKLSLVHEFGSFGEHLQGLAYDIDERPVEVGSRHQSVSVECTFNRDLPNPVACLEELPTLLRELDERPQRLDGSYRPDKPFAKPKFHDFTQTTVEQSGAGYDPESYRQLLGQASARGNRLAHPIGVGVRPFDLQGAYEQLRLP